MHLNPLEIKISLTQCVSDLASDLACMYIDFDENLREQTAISTVSSGDSHIQLQELIY